MSVSVYVCILTIISSRQRHIINIYIYKPYLNRGITRPMQYKVGVPRATDQDPRQKHHKIDELVAYQDCICTIVGRAHDE